MAGCAQPGHPFSYTRLPIARKGEVDPADSNVPQSHHPIRFRN